MSMIELMIAIVLSLVVTDAAVSLFLANRNAAQSTTGLAAISDNGRFALNMIEQSVRSAGYMACNALNGQGGTIPPPAATTQQSILPAGGTPVQNNYGEFGAAFGGYEASATGSAGAASVVAMPVAGDGSSGDWTGGLDPLLSGLVLKGTDVLVVREQSPQSITMYTTAPALTGASHLTVNDTGSLASLPSPQFPHAAVISTCAYSVAFQLGGVGAGNVINFGGGETMPITIPAYAAVAPIDTLIYYIGQGNDNDGALFVWDDGTQTSTELVPDVEGMQVLYGVAPTQANQVTTYVTADRVVPTVANFNQVISVKVALLLASPPLVSAVAVPATAPTFSLLGTTITAPKDSRLRKVVDVTIAARNATL